MGKKKIKGLKFYFLLKSLGLVWTGGVSACPDVSSLSRCLAAAQLTSPGLSKFPGPGPQEILSANITT